MNFKNGEIPSPRKRQDKNKRERTGLFLQIFSTKKPLNKSSFP
jgi:hypothetical protein